MRRKQGTLVPLEQDIIEVAQKLDGEEFYGYKLSRQLGEENSTVYRALLRLEKMGLLKSRWASGKGTGARKRYYRLVGQEAVR